MDQPQATEPRPKRHAHLFVFLLAGLGLGAIGIVVHAHVVARFAPWLFLGNAPEAVASGLPLAFVSGLKSSTLHDAFVLSIYRFAPMLVFFGPVCWLSLRLRRQSVSIKAAVIAMAVAWFFTIALPLVSMGRTYMVVDPAALKKAPYASWKVLEMTDADLAAVIGGYMAYQRSWMASALGTAIGLFLLNASAQGRRRLETPEA